MKSKRRHHSSEDDSEDSDVSARSSSSESESEESSASEHRHRKKKKRADSSDSDSDSDDHRRSKKRKHKKKKKKHVKRKRRSESVADSKSDADNDSSISDGEVSSRKKRKKHRPKRSRSSSASIEVAEHKERRLHSVVKERRRSSEDVERPVRTYYQKEYRSESPVDEFEKQREREVQRFYRGSSKERRFQEQYQYEERERNARNPRYENNRPAHTEEYQRRPREDTYHLREQPRGFNNRYNQYEGRGPKRNFEDGRDNRERERRGPPEPERFREREFPERRERFREEPFQSDRARDVRREKPPGRVDRPPPPPPQQLAGNNQSRSHSEERYKERNRRPEPRDERRPEPREERRPEPREERRPEPRDERRVEPREERRPEPRDERRPEPRDERYRDGRDGRGEPRREPRRDQRRPDRDRDRAGDKPEIESRERKSRFGNGDGDKEYSWGKTEVKKENNKDGEKEKPNFGLSGKLTADANTVNGVVIKYSEPDDAKQPKRRWRFYPFKGDKALPILYIHRQSAFLIGRDKKVCDIPLEHPSISKQHAALQYRATPFTRPDGTQGRRVRPYVIDLESANGTFVNNKKIEARRYVELLEKDVVKFGFSQREYVLLHENSKDDAQDDDNQETGPGIVTAEQVKLEKREKMVAAEDGE